MFKEQELEELQKELMGRQEKEQEQTKELERLQQELKVKQVQEQKLEQQREAQMVQVGIFVFLKIINLFLELGEKGD